LNKNIFTNHKRIVFIFPSKVFISSGILSPESLNGFSLKTQKGNLRCCLHWSGSGLLGVLSLVLAEGSQTSLCATVQDSLAILVHLELDDQQLRWVNSDVNVRSVGLLALDSFDIHDKLLTVDLHDLADLVAFVVTANDLKRGGRLMSIITSNNLSKQIGQKVSIS
jgi:hypothetical protein